MIGGTPFKKTQQHSRPRVLLFGGLNNMTFSTTFLLASQCLLPFFQALEVTAKDCLWHHWDTSTWRPVDSARLTLVLLVCHLSQRRGRFPAF